MDFFVPDIIVGAAVGLVVGWCFGPLAPIATRWLSQTSILQGLLQITVVALAISSQLFPYSTGAPKRVVLQHTYVTGSLFLESWKKNDAFSIGMVQVLRTEGLFDLRPNARVFRSTMAPCTAKSPTLCMTCRCHVLAIVLASKYTQHDFFKI